MSETVETSTTEATEDTEFLHLDPAEIIIGSTSPSRSRSGRTCPVSR